MKRHLEAFILRQRGGQHHWKQLAPVVEAMTEAQAEALYRLLQSTENDAKTEGGNQAMKRLGLPRRIV